MTPQAEARTLAVLTALARERHPGRRWQPAQIDRREPAPTTTLRQISRTQPSPTDPDPVGLNLPAASDNDAVDRRRQQPTTINDIQVRPHAA